MRQYISKDLLAILFLFSLAFGIFLPSLFNGLIFFGHDTPKIMFPLVYLLNEFFHSFQLPLWTPDIYFGFPVGSEGQVGLFYPFNLVHTFIPLKTAIIFLSLTHIFLAGVFSYLYGKIITLGRFASLIVGIAFMFNGFIVAHFQFFNFIYGYIYLPLILLLLELAIKKKKFIYFFYAGIAFGFQILSGHPNIPMMTIIYITIYFLFRSFNKLNFFISGILIFGLTALLISLPSTVLLLDLLPLSIREGGSDFTDITNSSFSMFDFITFIFPHFFFSNVESSWVYSNNWHFWSYWGQVETTGYVGIITLLLAPFSFFNKRKKLFFLFFLLLIISLTLALGKNTPIFRYLLEVPIFNGLRAPGRFLYLVDFSLIILAGLGMTNLQRLANNFKLRVIFLLMSIPLSLFSAVKLTIISIEKYPDTVYDFMLTHYGKLGFVAGIENKDIFLANMLSSFQKQTVVQTLLLFVSAMLLCIYIFVPKKSFIRWAIPLILIIDLFMFFYKVNPWIDYDTFISTDNEIINQLRKEVNYQSERVYTFSDFWSDLMPNQLIPYHIPDGNGFASLPLKRFTSWQKLAEEQWRNGNDSLFKIGSIKFVYDKENNMPQLSTIDNPLPRAYITNTWIIKESPDEILNSLINGHNKGVVFLESKSLDPKNLKTSPQIIPADITDYRPNYVKIFAKSNFEGVLVLTDTNYPGWEAYINGQKTTIYFANYLFRGVKLRPGTNIIEFKYKPKLLNTAIFISLSTLIFMPIFLNRKLITSEK